MKRTLKVAFKHLQGPVSLSIFMYITNYTRCMFHFAYLITQGVTKKLATLAYEGCFFLETKNISSRRMLLLNDLNRNKMQINVLTSLKYVFF